MEDCKLVRKKRRIRKGEKIFLAINILIIIGIIAFYAYRTVHYYKIEHDDSGNVTLKEKITKIGNIVYQNDGLYHLNNIYFYKGTNVDNYVYYSGRMYRIIEINKGIRLIDDETSTNLIWGIENNYQESLIAKYLEEYQKSLKDYEIYLTKTTFCNEQVDVSNYNCQKTLENYVGLLSTKEYLAAGGANSYLNNETYFWTVNYGEDSAYFVNDEGSINNVTHKNENYYSYGVRAVITLKEDLIYISGSGRVDDPYIIEENKGALLKDNSVGTYVDYRENNYRIMEISDDGVLLMMDGLLEDKVSYRNAYKYLNDTFLKTLNKEDLVIIKDSSNQYNFGNKYNYQEKEMISNNYVVLPKIGDMFLNEYKDYWLNTVENKTLKLYYTISDNKTFLADLDNSSHYLRPIIKVKGDMTVIDGMGTKESPIRIGE